MKKVVRFLNSDIIFSVLSRVPVKTLLCLKCICKEWHRIISSHSFSIAHVKEMETVFSGFILQEKFLLCNDDIKTISYIPVETGRARVQQTVFNFLPEDVVVLASCRGLVCCRSCLPSPDPVVYVCNPLNKHWIRLKLVNCDKNENIGLAFDPSKNPIDTSVKFDLVRVKQVENDEEDLYATFELYSSETRAWRKSTETCQCNVNLIKNKGVYIGGVLHWLTDGDEVLTFDVEKELSWLVSVPVPKTEFRSIPGACIGESEGRLHYVMISEDGVDIWFLEDYFEFKWTLKYCKTLEEIEKEYSQFFVNLRYRVSQRVCMDSNPWMDPLGYKDGILFMKVCGSLFLHDIENNKMSQACTLEDLNSVSVLHPTVLPYSMSLVPLNGS
ncbi:hypothetical protein L6164_034913 [Bauhinia variegata]|uniref:Uncharacterized protein n=1 Tax=Bauhinia variegata TaxID=167791 RepID=A0ACB9KWM6_BAUVA|nr:hypothetical protein L6164_034913 [Bauhinia variegata]